MKNIKQLTLSVLALTTALCAPELSCAASDDECAIWLCAPSSFPSPYCNGAYSAFKKRIKKGKSPFPSFSSCTVSADGSSTDEFSVVTGYAAVIPEHQEKRCIREEERQERTGYGRPYKKIVCVEYENYTVPRKYIEGTGCAHGALGPESNKPKNCSSTVQMYKVLDQNGNIIGDTFYYSY